MSSPSSDLIARLPYSGGLRLRPADWNAAAIAIAASIIGVTLFILMLDAVIFRNSLPADYVAFYTRPLLPRVIIACVMSGVEEVIYRLILMTLLIIMVTRWRGPPASATVVAVILLSQFMNIGALVVADPLYASLRFWAVGSVWGWLYWRHGWLAALIGHGSTHLLLDPALAAALLWD